MPKDKIRMSDLEWSRNMWSRIKSILTGHDNRISALEQGGGGGGQMNTIESISLNGTNVPPDANKNVALVEADPTVPSWAKANSKPSYTASEITDAVTGVKGNAESSYRDGNVNLTPNNIGAVDKAGDQVTGTITRKIDEDFSTPPASETWYQIFPIIDSDNYVRGGFYIIRKSNGTVQFNIGARSPGTGWVNFKATSGPAASDASYELSHPAAFRDALGLGNVNDSVVLTATDDTVAEIYDKLSALPVTQTDGGCVSCYLANAPLKLLTGKTGLSSVLFGTIMRATSTRFRIFGMYGDTGYMMYWAVDVTSSTITPMTVYKLQGTAM